MITALYDAISYRDLVELRDWAASSIRTPRSQRTPEPPPCWVPLRRRPTTAGTTRERTGSAARGSNA